MLFVMLQEQHNKQIAVIAATNKANMDTMMEWMNAMVAGRGGDRRTPTQQPDKENTPPRGNICPPTDLDRNKKPRKQKALCPHCKTFVLHKSENCYELEANKDKRWPGWKSVYATAREAPGMQTVDVELATNLVTTKLNSNYWSPLACLVEEQEEPISESHTNIDERAMQSSLETHPIR